MSIKVLLVDDHAILIDGLKALLSEQEGYQIGGSAHTGCFALAFLKKEQYDLMIADYSLPDMTGLELVRQAKAMVPGLKIIMLSMHDEPTVVREVIAAGADGYVLKKYARQELFHAIDAVLNNHPYWSAEISRLMLKSLQSGEPSPQTLTEREEEVLRLIVKEMTSKQIAKQLFISERTVETHRKNLMRKLKCSGTVGLIKYALSKNLI